MEDKRTAVCERCKSTVPISNVRYVKKDDDNFSTICKVCLDNAQSKPAENKPRSSPFSKKKYRCLRCKYGFGYDESSQRELKCPYCGKTDKIIPDKVDATSLLRDVEDETFINQ